MVLRTQLEEPVEDLPFFVNVFDPDIMINKCTKS
ncbi:MAG: hypothetical protein K0S32_3454 [Bacteroidetes bacterium]|jgi:hypothetical protein|nr:hypothetical protein [Bacteroidota bacterium]